MCTPADREQRPSKGFRDLLFPYREERLSGKEVIDLGGLAVPGTGRRGLDWSAILKRRDPDADGVLVGRGELVFSVKPRAAP
jgi:hypothetical protein